MNCFLDEEALRYADLEHKRGGTDFAFLGGLSKELVPFTQLVKVRRGKLVLALPSIRFS